MKATSARARALVAVAASLGLLGGCGASGPTHTTAARTVDLSRAAFVTMQTPGFHFDVRIAISVGGQHELIAGSGVFKQRAKVAALTLTLDGQHVLELIRYPYAYLRLPAGTQQANGKPWLRFNEAQLTGTQGLGSSASYDPAQTLDYLHAAGSVRRLGVADVHGSATTHYRALVDVDRLAALTPPAQRAAARQSARLLKRITGSNTLPIDVYLDDLGRARRVAIHLSICSGQGRLSETVTMDLYDFGAQHVQAPPPLSQVADVSGSLRKLLKQGESKLGCTKSASGPVA